MIGDDFAFLVPVLDAIEPLLAVDAYQLVAELLAPHLTRIDPATAAVHERLQQAAQIYTTVADPSPRDLRLPRWAWYAYRAALILHPRVDHGAHPSVNAPYLFGQLSDYYPATTLMAVLREVEAARLQAAGEHAAHLDTRMSIATTLHADGHCAAAAEHATRALTAWRPHHDTAPASTILFLVEALHQLEQCGHQLTARHLLTNWTPILSTLSPADRAFAVDRGHDVLGTPDARTTHQPWCTAVPEQPRSGRGAHRTLWPAGSHVLHAYLTALTGAARPPAPPQPPDGGRVCSTRGIVAGRRRP